MSSVYVARSAANLRAAAEAHGLDPDRLHSWEQLSAECSQRNRQSAARNAGLRPGADWVDILRYGSRVTQGL